MSRFCNDRASRTYGAKSSVQSRRSGYTLIELVIATASAAMLIGGLASTAFISRSVLSTDSTPGTDANRGAMALSRLTADVRQAIRFTQRTATAVTFLVPDRNGDGQMETIRYWWSGVAGDPLMYQYNSETAVAIVSNVKQFELAAVTRLL